MISTPSARQNRRFAQPRAVVWALWGAILGCILLEIWRPLYFFGDDNMNAWWPVVLEAGRRLWSGHSPFVNDYLFGGHYDLLRDPGALCLWNPLLLLFSPLSLSPARFAICDCYACTYLLLSAFCFAHLLVQLRETQSLTLSDAKIVFLTLSYTFSVWAVVTGSAWLMFLANQAALPLFLLGFLHPKRRQGVALVGLSFLLCVTAGHLNSTTLTLVFFAVFLGVYGLGTGSWEWARRFLYGDALALLIASPLLFLALQGFGGMNRSHALSTSDAALFAVPAPVLLFSPWFGMLVGAFTKHSMFFLTAGTTCSIATFMAAWGCFHSIGPKMPRLTPLERACLVSALVVALFMVRPDWLGHLLAHLPLLRSTRIPFREGFALVFFLHLWIALRPPVWRPALRHVSFGLGVAVFLASLLPFKPPVFTPFPLDRRMILSGEAERYWQRVTAMMPRNTRILPVIGFKIGPGIVARVPWILIGAYSWPSALRINSESGYVIKGMKGVDWHGFSVQPIMGTLLTKNLEAMRRADPKAQMMVMESWRPLRIYLVSGNKKIPIQTPVLPKVTQDSFDLEKD